MLTRNEEEASGCWWPQTLNEEFFLNLEKRACKTFITP